MLTKRFSPFVQKWVRPQRSLKKPAFDPRTTTRKWIYIFSSLQGGDGESDGEDEADGPIVERNCPKCGYGRMSYAALQLRSADEGQTVFFTCLKCKHKESENSWNRASFPISIVHHSVSGPNIMTKINRCLVMKTSICPLKRCMYFVIETRVDIILL